MTGFDTLNDVQRKAVLHTQGPCLIFAGAGSGKTRVLTHRIAHIIQNEDVLPANILALTFTNKAAREMKSRIETLIASGTAGMFVGTFHSLCAFFLRADGGSIGIGGNFTIFDTADQNQLISECMKRLNIDEKQLPKRFFRAKISEAKNLALYPDAYAREFGLNANDPVFQVYKRYEARLKECAALDFDDLLLRAVELLENSKETLGKYQERFTYIHVDEYQDTNAAQYRLLKLLAARHRNLCVVGDDDQSIYSWRGADITNILNFEKDYPDAAVFYLEQNYRSTEHILQTANAVIANNPARKQKKLWSRLGRGERVKVFTASDEYDEAQFVANEIMRLHDTEYIPLENMAVLYRTNAQSRVFEEKFMRYSLPYRIYGGLKFYDRREIKDLVAYLRILANPRDDVSLLRIINTPRRGIGNTTVQKLAAEAVLKGESIMDILMDLDASDLDARTRKKLEAFCALISRFIALSQVMPPSGLIEAIIDETGYAEHLESEHDENVQSRLENLDEFIASVAEYEQNAQEVSLHGFLETVSLSSDMDEEKQKSRSAVTLMTLHSAKGLEFEVVFLVGLEDNLFPHASAQVEPGELEEERRLCYVGITRAQRRLYLSHALERRSRHEKMRCRVSRFISEMPRDSLYILKPHLFSRQAGMLQEDEGNRPWNPPLKHERQRVAIEPKRVSYSVADRVEHDRFGRGTVVRVDGQGENATLTVAFEGQGIKKLSVAYAPLRRLEVNAHG
ncbi:MAG: ATP-dependent helicase [Bacillota bacterium]